MPRLLQQIGAILCIVALVFCAVSHVTSFFCDRLIGSLASVLTCLFIPAFVCLFAAGLCQWATGKHRGRARNSARDIQSSTKFLQRLGFLLLAYAVLLLIWEYRTTGGATDAAILHGQYVYTYKSQVIRAITEREYRLFPILVARVMSAWIGAMSVWCLVGIAD